MKIHLATAVAMFGMCAAHASGAAEVTGGSLDAEYSFYTDDSSFARLSVNGSMEVGFARSFATQFDIGAYHFNTLGDTGYNGTAHAIYHVNDQASVGAFVGRDDLASLGMTFYGLEAGFELDNFTSELYYSTGDISGVNGDIYGLEFGIDFAGNFGARASVDKFDLGGVADSTRLAVGLDYRMNNGGTLYGEIGTGEANALGTSLGSATFVGLGAKINLGATRGSTFGRRGVLDLEPGF